MRTNQTKELSGLPPIEPGTRKQTMPDGGLGELPPLPAPIEKHGWMKRYIFRFIALILLFALSISVLEIVFQRLYTRDTDYDWLQYHSSRLYIHNPNAEGMQFNTEWDVNELGFRGPLPGLKTKKRILCLGDSRTFGNQVAWNESYPGKLAALMPDYEVINGGTYYYTSYQGKVLFEEVYQKLHPDVVIIAFGYHDRCYVPRHEMADGIEAFQRVYPLHFIQNYLRYSVLFQQAVTHFQVKETQSVPPILALQPRVDTVQFRKNIQTILQLCAQNSIKTILLDIGEKPDEHVELNAGIAALNNQNYAEALQQFYLAKNRIEADSRIIGTYYYVLTCQLMGRMEEADTVQYEYPFQYTFPGVQVIRHTKEYSKILLDLSEQYNVQLMNFLDLTERNAGYFQDHYHPNASGNALISERIQSHLHEMQ